MQRIDRAHLRTLRTQSREVLGQVIDTGNPVALVDIPGHANVGDHAILAGELEYLRALDVPIAYLSDIRRFDPELLRSRMPVGTILIQGGGNVGDTWPEHHQFKESLALAFPDYPIVQLPQSVYFADASNAMKANRALGSHDRFTLMVRDSSSEQRARDQLPDVVTTYAPDMALGWSPPLTPWPERPSTVALCRTDRESTHSLGQAVSTLLGDDDVITDWNMNILETIEFLMGKVPGKLGNRVMASVRRNVFYPLYRRSVGLITDANLRHAERLFSDVSCVVTDRLHAHIMATLMGIPNIVVENSYGKIGPIYQDYMAGFSTTHFARNDRELATLYGQVTRGRAA